MSRPQTSLGTRKLHASSISISRPATSLEHHQDENVGSVLGKRKGMQPLFSSIRSSFCPNGPMDPHLHAPRLKESRSVSISGMDPKRMAQGSPMMNPLSTQKISSDVGPTESTPARPGKRCNPPIPKPSKPVPLSPVSPQRKSKRAPIPCFLSKESTVTNFFRPLDSEWDQEMKEKTMEEIMARVFSRVNQSGQESQGLKEAVEIYKARSE